MKCLSLSLLNFRYSTPTTFSLSIITGILVEVLPLCIGVEVKGKVESEDVVGVGNAVWCTAVDDTLTTEIPLANAMAGCKARFSTLKMALPGCLTSKNFRWKIPYGFLRLSGCKCCRRYLTQTLWQPCQRANNLTYLDRKLSYLAAQQSQCLL